MSVVSTAQRMLSPGVRRPLGKAARAAIRRMPKPVRGRLTRALGWKPLARADRPVQRPVDPLGLSDGVTAGGSGAPAAVAPKRATAGRGAAAGAVDPEAALRLHRALTGGPFDRPGTGGRAVGGIMAADLGAALQQQGHALERLRPGTALAATERIEALVIDLAGFTGLWGGGLDAEGVALYLEITAAIDHAMARGVTTWLVDRGPDRHRLGAVALRRHPGVLPVRPDGPPQTHHITEDPGDAPVGIVGILQRLDEGPAQRLDERGEGVR